MSVETGDVVWSRDLKSDFDLEAPVWGVASHPLIDSLKCRTQARARRDQYDGMKLLAPVTRLVSAHAYNDDEPANETKWDYRRFMKNLTEGGFSGYVAIEYFGLQTSREDGTRGFRMLLERVKKELTQWCARFQDLNLRPQSCATHGRVSWR